MSCLARADIRDIRGPRSIELGREVLTSRARFLDDLGYVFLLVGGGAPQL